MLITEKKLRNIIIQSLLKEYNTSGQQSEINKNLLNVLSGFAENLKDVSADKITPTYFEDLMWQVKNFNELKKDPVYAFCRKIGVLTNFLKRTLRQTDSNDEDSSTNYSTAINILASVDQEYYNKIAAAVMHIRKKFIYPYLYGTPFEKLKKETTFDNQNFKGFIKFFTTYLPWGWKEAQEKWDIDGLEGFKKLRDDDFEEFENCFQFMLDKNANGETAKYNALVYFGNILNIIRILKNEFSKDVTSFRDTSKKQFKYNLIDKLKDISALASRQKKLKLNARKLKNDITALENGNEKDLTPNYPAAKLLKALKGNNRKQLMSLINKNSQTDNNEKEIFDLIYQ